MPAHKCHNSPEKNWFIGAIQAGIPITKATELHHIPKQTASDIWLKFKKKLAQHMLSLALDLGRVWPSWIGQSQWKGGKTYKFDCWKGKEWQMNLTKCWLSYRVRDCRWPCHRYPPPRRKQGGKEQPRFPCTSSCKLQLILLGLWASWRSVLTWCINLSATRTMFWRASKVVLMIEMSSEVIQDSVWCCWGIGRVWSGLVGEAGGDRGGGEGFQKEVGRLGLGARQFGLSERFRLRARGSLWGGGSLQPSEWPGLGRPDPLDVL
jgi:hypothetical protein